MAENNNSEPDKHKLVILSGDNSVIDRLRCEAGRSGFSTTAFHRISEVVEWEKANKRDTRICIIDTCSDCVSFGDAVRAFEKNSLSVDVILLLDTDNRMNIRDLKRYGVHDAFLRESVFSDGIAGMLTRSVSRLLDEKQRVFPGDEANMSLSLYDTEWQWLGMLININHQIRNPLGGITGMAKMLEKTTLSREQRDYVRGILFSSGKIEAIIGHLTECNGPGSAEPRLYCSNFNPRVLVNDVISLYTSNRYIESRDFETEFTGDLPVEVNADRFRVEQILNNLVDYAVKRKGDSRLKLVVGQVCGEKNRKYLEIKLGWRAEKRLVIRDNLDSIIKNLVVKLGGRVSFATNDKGEYHVVSSFPLCNRAGSPLAPGDTKEYHSEKQLRILIAEDDMINQTYLKRLAESFGWEADVASNGEIALELFSPGKYDLVIMDGQMPGMDGFEASRRIREKEKGHERTPIIAISGYAIAEFNDRFKEAGIDDFLSKPVDEDLLHKTVQKITDRS